MINLQIIIFYDDILILLYSCAKRDFRGCLRPQPGIHVRHNCCIFRTISNLFHLGAVQPFKLKDIDGVRIRAAEHRRARRLPGDLAAVAQDVGVDESHMHGHRAELAALGVKIPALADTMAAVAAARAFSFDERDADLRAFHLALQVSSSQPFKITAWLNVGDFAAYSSVTLRFSSSAFTFEANSCACALPSSSVR